MSRYQGLRGSLYGSLLLCLLFVPRPSVAQSAQARKDSLRQLREDIATHMDRIHYADSVGDARDAARWRIMLAGFIQPSKRQRLLEEAVAIADSADLLGEELRARTGLMNALRAAGNIRRAYDEAQLVIALTAQREQEEAARYAEIEKWHTDSTVTARDSVEQDLQQVLREARHRESGMEAMAERWLFISLGLGAVWVLTVVVLLVGLRQQRIRTRKEIEALRAEIAAMKQAPKNRFRDPAPTVELELPPVQVPAPAPTVVPPAFTPDPEALAFFRRKAPERLETLRSAIAGNDHEKTVRVVHTLKPHLEALDPQGLGALCIRIRAMDPTQDPAAWNAAMGELTSGVERLLREA